MRRYKYLRIEDNGIKIWRFDCSYCKKVFISTANGTGQIDMWVRNHMRSFHVGKDPRKPSYIKLNKDYFNDHAVIRERILDLLQTGPKSQPFFLSDSPIIIAEVLKKMEQEDIIQQVKWHPGLWSLTQNAKNELSRVR